MSNIAKALENLDRHIAEKDRQKPLDFNQFLQVVSERPNTVIRNVFQVFDDMIKSYVGVGVDEYPDDPESINYVSYDCHRLLVEGTDHPFFADRLFANRLINQIESMRKGAQQNKIYIFEGPPGSGKSTFLNNLLKKFEMYCNTPEGMRYETVWRLDRKLLGAHMEMDTKRLYDKFFQFIDSAKLDRPTSITPEALQLHQSICCVEVPCPSHDNPILTIPKSMRRAFFDDLFKNDEFKWKLFTEKEYEWVFRDMPCTICSSLFQAIVHHLGSPLKAFEMMHARPYSFNRRLGEGISVFNPGDKPARLQVQTNEMLQERINSLLGDSNQVRYVYSTYAKTNNGIYALMDIKSHNNDRLMQLHNIVSEGVHKIEDIEENVNSLFISLINPEDKPDIESIQSFTDRIEYINILYVLDVQTEVEIYREVFGRHIDASFLPRVLNNFARVIIATRLKPKSEAMMEWIPDPKKYRFYCDEDLQLLKMEVYSGNIPSWLKEEDRKGFNAKIRKKILAEADQEGAQGFSGRDAIKIFGEFYSLFKDDDKLIDMSILKQYFTKIRKDLIKQTPQGFLDSLTRLYNYTVLQEVKESLYYYNESKIINDIKNYLFAINFDAGTTEQCVYTGDRLDITEAYFESLERHLIGADCKDEKRKAFRYEAQAKYASKTLTQEMSLEGKELHDTEQFGDLFGRYTMNLKEKVLEPFLGNENFRNALKDFDRESFKTYDKRIREDVQFLISNLQKKYSYTEQGAREVCIYVIDNDIAKNF